VKPENEPSKRLTINITLIRNVFTAFGIPPTAGGLEGSSRGTGTGAGRGAPPGVSAATLMLIPTANLPTFPGTGAGEAGEAPTPDPVPEPTGGLPPGIGGLNFPELGDCVDGSSKVESYYC